MNENNRLALPLLITVALFCSLAISFLGNMVIVFLVSALGIVIFFYLALTNLQVSLNIRPSLYEVVLFFLLFSGPPRFRSRDPMASLRGEIDWVVALNLIIWGLGALWVFFKLLAALYSKRRIRLYGAESIALLLAVSLALSIPISISPLLSGFRVFQIVVMILFTHFWVRRFGIDVTIRLLLLSYIAIGISIFIAAFWMPELVYVPYGSGYRLRGDYIANAGAIGAIGLIMLLSYPVLRPRWVLLILVPMFSFILLASRTRSAYAGLILFLILLLLRLPRIQSMRLVRYALILSMPIIVIYHDSIFHFLIREEHSVSTLSDRTRVWQYLFSQVLGSSPLLGVGFATERVFTLQVNPGVGTAHGAFAAIFAGGGILAAITYIALLITLTLHAIKLFFVRNSEGFGLVSVFLAILTISVVSEETVMATPTGFTFYLFVSLFPYALHFWRRRRYAHSSRPQPLSPTRR